jgi:hypothetical protein
VLDRLFHYILVKSAVRLDALGVHGGAFAEVEHSVLQHYLVGGLAHFAAESVYFKNELTFSRAAYGGVAGHIADSVVGDGKKCGAAAHSCGGERGFYACVARADYGYVYRINKIFHILPFYFLEENLKKIFLAKACGFRYRSTFFFEKKVAKKQKSLQDLSALSVQVKTKRARLSPR